MNGLKNAHPHSSFAKRLLVLGALFLVLGIAPACDDGDDAQPYCTIENKEDGTDFTCEDGQNDEDIVVDKKNVILIIGDGMQKEHEIAASRYLHGTDNGLSFHDGTAFPFVTNATTWDVTTYNRYARYAGVDLFKFGAFDPIIGYDPSKGGAGAYPEISVPDETYFLDKYPSEDGMIMFDAVPATDSAAAATAMATGIKTDVGNIAWLTGDPLAGYIPTIAELARAQRDVSIGVISTVPFSHATPAAFVSHNPNRGDYVGIGDEIVFQTRPDVVIGGGHPAYYNCDEKDQPCTNDLYFMYMSKKGYDYLTAHNNDYVLVERTDGINGSAALLAGADKAIQDGKKLFGYFGGKGGNIESPIPSNSAGAPAVAKYSDENPSLADASEAALKVLSQNDSGFFLMIEQGDIDWSNHANDYAGMIGTTYDLDETVKKVVSFVDQDSDDIDWSNTLLIITSDHSNSYLRLPAAGDAKVLGRGELPAQEAKTDTNCTADYCGGYVYPRGEIKYSTGGHTNEPVSIYAKGDGADLFKAYKGWWYPQTNLIDNTHIYYVMQEFMKIEGSKF